MLYQPVEMPGGQNTVKHLPVFSGSTLSHSSRQTDTFGWQMCSRLCINDLTFSVTAVRNAPFKSAGFCRCHDNKTFVYELATLQLQTFKIMVTTLSKTTQKNTLKVM